MNQRNMHVAKVKIHPDFLCRALHLPEDVEFRAVRMTDDYPQGIELTIAHSTLPIVGQGCVLAVVDPQISMHSDSFSWSRQ